MDLVAAVTAATATPARLLGLEGRLGRLAPGLRADVLVVDDDLRPVTVILAGQMVHPSGQLAATFCSRRASTTRTGWR